MALVWDAGTAITGQGSVTPAAPYARVHLTTIPGWFSRSAETPARYYDLGVVGTVDGAYRSRGIRLTYADQEFALDLTSGTDLYWSLPTGVLGTLYRGVGIMTDTPVACAVYNSAAQNALNNTLTKVTFNTELSDPWGMHDVATNPTRVTVPVPGWYAITGRVTWNVSANGWRDLNILVNNATVVAGTSQSPAGGAANWLTQEVVGTVYLATGDYVEMQAYQTSGATIALQVNNPMASSLTVVKVA